MSGWLEVTPTLRSTTFKLHDTYSIDKIKQSNVIQHDHSIIRFWDDWFGRDG